ncbi:hypothetical protein B0H14DRAFT_2576766 [Mycena olivaceomarginata]|nr:hypothetical protein B0H14DRAFT_2576766 [Mycena olivaceomarginata]
MYHQYPSARVVLRLRSSAQDCIQQATHRQGSEERSREPPVRQGSGEVESDKLEELGQEGEEGRGLVGIGMVKTGHCATLKFRHEVWIGRCWRSGEGGGARDEREAKQGGRAEAVALKRVVEKKGPRLKTTQELKFSLAAERTEVMRKNTRTEVQHKLKCTGELKSGWT